jgi:phospholipase D1/2
MSHKAGTLELDRNKAMLYAGIAILVVAALIIFSTFAYDDEALWKNTLTGFLEQARGTPWALPFVCLAYVVGGAVFFPVILLNLVCAMVFGLWGILYAIIGGMLNAAVYFGIGYFIRHHRGGKKWLSHHKIKPVDKKLQKAGLAGVVLIHSLPAPPFTVTNFIAGLSSINFPTFYAGTLIALLPGAIARGIVGDSLIRILLNPTMDTYLYLGLGIALWVALIAGTHTLLKKFAPHTA